VSAPLLRTALGATGAVLIWAGALVLSFVGYQLFGTSVAAARAQDGLRADFAEVSNALKAIRPVPGGAVGIIEIPKIGVDWAVVEGVGTVELKAGPGHYPATPMPGQPGNAAIAAHRTTYGAPFNRLDELTAGDAVLVTTSQGEFRYEVRSATVVDPSAAEVLDPTDDSRLTLTTCHPEFSARQRLIVVAELASPPASPPTTPVGTSEGGGGAGGDSLDAGLSGDPAARWPALAWALATATVALLIKVVGAAWRKVPVRLIGAPIFVLSLFLFFESFARLLPPNV